jgi:hypothetical protein
MDFEETQGKIVAQDRPTLAPKLLKFCEYGNELSGTINGGEFLVQNLQKAVVA